MLKLASKNVLVYGLGRTGEAVIDFLKNKKAIVLCCDDLKEGMIGEIKILKPSNISLDEVDLIVVSPGIKLLRNKLLERAKKNNVHIISEMELACAFFKGDMFAITGTNGKTTTVSLLSHIFSVAKKKNTLCGNIGTPLVAEWKKFHIKHKFVVECSSFQLENFNSFMPKYSAFLNVSPDHLERHGNFSEYFASKQKILTNQSSHQYAVLNFDDEKVRNLYKITKAKTFFFSLRTIVKGAYVKDGEIFTYIKKTEKVCKCREVKLLGKKNLENVLCAVCLAKLAGVKNCDIAQGLKTFEAIEHRLEFVATKDGVMFVNDSKATNCDSTNFACESFNQNIVLLLGGQGKGQDFSSLEINKNVVKIIIYGEDKDKIFSSLSTKLLNDNIEICDNMIEAFKKACKVAKKGDVVLLSPACASFDEFADYCERGQVFKKLVEKL